MHRQFGHCPLTVLVEVLRGSNAKDEFIKEARLLRCDGCDAHKPKPQTSKTTLPRTFQFNEAVGVDIFEIKDSSNTRYSMLSFVCQGTCYHQAYLVKTGGGQIPSRTCFKLFSEPQPDLWIPKTGGE